MGLVSSREENGAITATGEELRHIDIGSWFDSEFSGERTPTLRLALELADELDMPLLLGPQVHNIMRMARGKGGGGDNVTAVLKVYETIMGQQVGPGK